jgi:N-acetylmuramoyl-L-alanine amidase
MIRCLLLCVALLGALSNFCAAQGLNAVARVNTAESGLEQNWRGQTILRLQLSQGVPFRIFTLADPARLVLDFREVDWSGVRAGDLLAGDTGVAAMRFGVFQPGWSRLVADLTRPMLPEDIGMAIDPESGEAVLSLVLEPVSEAAFSAAAGAPADAHWPEPGRDAPVPPLNDDRFVVAIDPGHGGLDPGAEREGLTEKDLMLTVAHELREVLLRTGEVDVVLTRDRDMFVSLQGRVALAHRAGADAFLSLHADALSEGGAQGATVYILSEEASDTATAHLAERHNRADIIAGADLSGSDDEIASVLLDLARQETEPRSLSLAHALITGMTEAGGPMNRRPLRQAGFSVLKSADIPSVLVEVGFLSSKRDLDNIRNPEWRRTIVEGMAQAILTWRDADAAKRALVRK